MISLIEQKDKEIIRLKKGSIQYSSISQEDNSIQETLRTEKAKWKQQMQSKLENELKRKYRIYEEKIEELSKALESKIDAHQNIDSKLLFVRISELEKEIEIRNLRIKECEMNLNRESILQDKLKEKDQICTTLLEKLNILEKENINLYDRIEYLEDESTHSSIPKHLQEENQILHSKIRELASRLNATDRDQDCDCSSDNLLIERIEELERILDVYEKKNFRGKLDSERRKLAKANSDIELLKHENESLVSELRFLKDEKLCFTVGKKKASPSLSLQIETRNLLGKVDDNSSSQKFDTFKVTKFSNLNDCEFDDSTERSHQNTFQEALNRLQSELDKKEEEVHSLLKNIKTRENETQYWRDKYYPKVERISLESVGTEDLLTSNSNLFKE